MKDEQFILDVDLLLRAIRLTIAGAWFKVLVGAVVLFVVGGLTIPQSYTATSSVALQMATPMSTIGLLTGQGGSKRYLGIIKSRSAAEYVESVVHLRQFYGMKSTDDAVTYLQNHVTPDDNVTDGLLYVRFTAPGPPRLMPAASRRADAKRLVTRIVNTYVEFLRQYYADQDTDQDAVLLRSADVELRKAQANFDESLDRLKRYSKGLGHVDPRAYPAVDGTSSAPSESELSKLYENLGTVETQIQADEAARTAQQQMTAGQLHNLNEIPAEDPLLADARRALDQDQADLTLLQTEYGPRHPAVLRKQAQVELDRERLNAQRSGIEQNKTTAAVRLDTQIDSLKARAAALQDQIRNAEGHLSQSRRLTSDYLALRTQFDVSLEALKATAQEAAKIRLENATAANRMSVVDPAEVPTTGSPSLGIIAALSAVLALLGFGVVVARVYLREASRNRLADVPEEDFAPRAREVAGK